MLKQVKQILERILPRKIFYFAFVIKQNLFFNLSVLRKIIFGSQIYNSEVFPAFIKNTDDIWENYSSEKMIKTIKRTLLEINYILNLDKVIEFGCGKEHFTPHLKKISKFLYGVDVIDEKLVSKSIDKYIKCQIEKKDSYLDDIPSETVDCIFILHVSGYGFNKGNTNFTDFKDIFENKSHRTGRYINDFRRVLKKNGIIVLIEYSLNIHLLFNKKDSIAKVNKDFKKYFPVPKISGFENIYGKLKDDKTGPIVVLKKT